MFTIDAHLDLAMNALEWNRDMRCTTAEINARELARGLADKPDRGKATVSLPDLRRGSADHRLHRRPGGDREDPHLPGCERG